MVDVLIVGVEGNIVHPSLSVIVALVYLSLFFSNSIRVVDIYTRGHEGNCYEGGHKIVEVENFGFKIEKFIGQVRNFELKQFI